MTNWVLMARANLLHDATLKSQDGDSIQKKDLENDPDISSELN